MADVDFDDYGASLRIGAGQVQGAVRLTALVCSLGLVVGAVVWGYRLAERDVAGIPLIRAAEGPARVAPDNPGGTVADYQGMAINAIAAVGNAEALPDEIILAPPPVALLPEDVPGLGDLPPMFELATPAPDSGPAPLLAPPVETAPPAAVGAAPLTDAAQTAVEAADDALATALAEALSLGAKPLEADPSAAVVDAAAPEPAVDLAAPDADAPARSIRPQRRPDALVSLEPAATTDAAGLSEPSIPRIDPATLPVGTRLVQLGAFDSDALATGEWVKLLARFGDLMTGKTLVVEAAVSGGRTFYRLRAHGFAGEDDVRRFCAALVAENAACIPARVR